jgi:hypothetical protein
MNTFHGTHVDATAMFLKNSFGNPAGYTGEARCHFSGNARSQAVN